MQCELCGRECDCRPASVDGVRMMLCPGCIKRHGKQVKEDLTKSSGESKPDFSRIKKQPVYRDVYKDKGLEKDLVSDWNKRIMKARQKKSLSREELGFKVGERTTTIGKIENGDLRPSDETIKKLEKELDINLMEEVKEVSETPSADGSKRGLTLGDFIKEEE
ncbi:MAG: multiprotein bridging factor aMBF1 [Candidatus Thermoplasmatota archaeon]